MSGFTKSFVFAWNGLRSCLLTEPNFKIHIICSLCVLAAGAYFTISPIEWVMVLVCITIVLTMEMINTAIEKLCDAVHPGMHPGIKATKDIAAGAVLVSAIFAAICGAIIFIPKIFLLIKSMRS